MDLLSVIIPTYNSVKVIDRCLNSLLSQTYQDFEICIIDGGSTDETLAIISNFRVHSQNIRLLSEPDKGTYDAMNKGIDIAQGDWLYFLGSDDEVADKDVFADIFNISTPIPRKCGMIYGNVYICGETSWAKASQIYDGAFDINKLLTKNICHQAIFYRKTLFKKLGKYQLKYPVCADWDINLRFFPATQPIYVDRVIANFSGGGLSSGAINDPIGYDLEKLRKQAKISYHLHRLTSLFKF